MPQPRHLIGSRQSATKCSDARQRKQRPYVLLLKARERPTPFLGDGAGAFSIHERRCPPTSTQGCSEDVTGASATSFGVEFTGRRGGEGGSRSSEHPREHGTGASSPPTAAAGARCHHFFFCGTKQCAGAQHHSYSSCIIQYNAFGVNQTRQRHPGDFCAAD